MFGSIEFILVFFGLFPITYLLDSFIDEAVGRNKFLSFTILHCLIVPFLNYTITDVLWFSLTYSHGLSHIFHPALHGTIFNENYTPIYDYLVHAAQCLCINNYHPDYLPVGIMLHSSMLLGAIIAHLDRKFLETLLWVIVSAGGVFGTHYHMMLLNTHHNYDIYVASLIIWITPYLGYLNRKYIPQWDSILNKMGLFRLWYFHYFIITRIFDLL